jgi:hypothetical protein
MLLFFHVFCFISCIVIIFGEHEDILFLSDLFFYLSY